jgi:hypothetical protein
MSLSAKREALARIYGRYQRAGRPHKTRILDEFCATCGYHRKAALRLLSRPLPTRAPKRTGPNIFYVPVAVVPGLKAVWLACVQLCSKLLKAACCPNGSNTTSDAPRRGAYQKVMDALKEYLEPAETPDEQSPVRAAYRYLTHQVNCLGYPRALKLGLPIGSGLIESGHQWDAFWN